MSTISWLEQFAGAAIRYLGTDLTQRGTIEFAGDGVIVTDDATDPTDAKTVVRIDGSGVASRRTPLDANHLHAWELTETSGNFADTGSSASKVNLTASGSPIYATPGLFGPCPFFGIDSAGAASTAKGTAPSSAFTDLPTGSCTLECWYRSYANGLGILCGWDYVGASTFLISGGGTNTGAMNGACYATTSKQLVSQARVNGAMQGWRYAAMTYDQASGNCFLYLDGEIVAKATGQTGSVVWTFSTTPGICIGKSANNPASDGLVGQLSRVRLSNIARSQAYCRAVYAKAMGL